MFQTADEVPLKYLIGKTYKYMETLKEPARREVKSGEFNEFRDASYTLKIDSINKAIRLVKRSAIEFREHCGNDVKPTISNVFAFLAKQIEQADESRIAAVKDAGGRLYKRRADLDSMLAAVKFCLHLAAVHNLR